ncbi:hypothetical protein PBAL39_03025 [Pedobacter sp. BAL39]|uniref:SusD/RagB family nutrient-binding outer membrane lipoprotein n=1 Tax=Pedobacter sp. BAL39 TaxID=391596 RepID=UPI000155A6A3|nr:SusD/RagB family nutrient-binding outer membrane lipoprotein [Pedobacter sp. BAL39]EDM34835.1 hypothetical protein PBAL39_03025 [Pedobacter sp. BAL39]
MKRITLVLLACCLMSCTKLQLDQINTDPTKSTDENFDPNQLLSTAQFNYANIGYYQLLYESTMMQVLSSTYYYYNNGDKYINTANFTDYQGKLFDQGYTQGSTIREMQRLARQKDAAGYSNLIAIGDIVYILIMQRVTDMYGDVPYSEANRAAEGIKYPVYDRQQDIYLSMLNDLEKAILQLDVAKAGPTADLIYKGDVRKWKRFGYSLMLRLAMRMTRVSPELARLWAEKASAGGTFADVADNAMVPTDATNHNSQNGTAIALRTLSDYREVRWSKTLIDELVATGDPRLNVISEVSQPGLSNNLNTSLPGNSDPSVQQGLPNGYDLLGGATDIRNATGYPGATGSGSDLAPLGKYSRPVTAIYLKLDGANFIMTYAETELLLAEASMRGWAVSGTADQHYQDGVSAALESMSQLDIQATITPSKITAYLSRHPLDTQDLETALRMINTQYWLVTGTTFNFIETWFNWRRSGYPLLQPVRYPGNNTNGTIPRRMIYLSTEILNNTDNYTAAVARMQGGDALTSRVWWDVN